MLPLHCDIQTFIEYAVAPYVGAWIETTDWGKMNAKELVAPYVGALIESKDKGTETFGIFTPPRKLRSGLSPNMFLC